MSRLRRTVGRVALVLILLSSCGCASLRSMDPGRGFRVWAVVWAVLAVIVIGADELNEESAR